MKILSLRISNFKQFYGDQTVLISYDDNLNVTVFHGDNGTGKTSLFTAINWCLYGVGDEGTGELLNKQLFAESEEGTELQVIVTIRFRHSNYEYIAERARRFKKTGNQALNESNEFILSTVDSKGNTNVISNPMGKMDSILPKNVREYFFFNGEKMEDLTKPGNGKIEDAIKNIMRLPIIDKTEEHIRVVAKDYRKEIQKNGNVTIETLINQQNEIEQSIISLKNKIKELENEISMGNRQVEDLERILSESREVGLLQSLRKKTEAEVFQLEEQRTTITLLLQKLVNQVYARYLRDKAENALSIIDQLVAKGKIPSGIREQFIENLLNEGICICGRPLEKGSDCYATLYNLSNSTKSSEIEDMVLNLRGYIRTISNLTAERMNQITEICKNLENINDQIERKNREIDDLGRKIGDSIDIDIAKIESKLLKEKMNIGTNNQEIGASNSRINVLQAKSAEIQQRRNEEERKQKELILLNIKEQLAQTSADAVTQIKERFYEETRLQIEEETKRVFGLLAWKQDQFNDIRLDPNFHLEVIDRWGRPSREELSAGERQILSLSFIAAMARLSGEEAPVIMDTPFARLSGKHLENTSINIPKLVPQLILFVTDKEWNESSRVGLECRVGYHYQLNFMNGCTVIEEV